jgi:signal transduction histidine kinase
MEATAPIHDPISHPDEREFLMGALLEVAERENRRIGQELHDHLCQVLLGAAFAAKAVALNVPPGSPAAAELGDLVRLISSAAQQTRDIARSLHPIEMDSAGLAAALQQLVATPHAGFVCRLECPEFVVLPDSATALHLYRIASEAVANAVQHSGGAEIVVRLTADKQGIHLRITDDGRGFEGQLPPLNGRTGLGLALMKYRAEAIGGDLRFDTRDRRGTSVTCSVPKPT